MLFATAAGVLHPIVLQHFEPSRNQLQLLAAFHADFPPLLAATRTRPLGGGKFMPDDFAVEMCGQFTYAARRFTPFATRGGVFSVFVIDQFFARLGELSGDFLKFLQRKQQ